MQLYRYLKEVNETCKHVIYSLKCTQITSSAVKKVSTARIYASLPESAPCQYQAMYQQ